MCLTFRVHFHALKVKIEDSGVLVSPLDPLLSFSLFKKQCVQNLWLFLYGIGSFGLKFYGFRVLGVVGPLDILLKFIEHFLN